MCELYKSPALRPSASAAPLIAAHESNNVGIPIQYGSITLRGTTRGVCYRHRSSRNFARGPQLPLGSAPDQPDPQRER